MHLAAQLHQLSHSLHLKEQGRNFQQVLYFYWDQGMDWILILLEAVLGIRILNWIRACMFSGLPDLDPLVRGKDPAPDPTPDSFLVS